MGVFRGQGQGDMVDSGEMATNLYQILKYYVKLIRWRFTTCIVLLSDV